MLSHWYDKHAFRVYRRRPSRNSSEWIEWSDEDNISASGADVDCAVDDLYNICNEVKEWMTKTVKVKLPTTIPKTANAQEVKIGQLSALLGEFSARISKKKDDRTLRESFNRIEKEKFELTKKVSREKLESKMRYLSDGVQRCSKNFFEITGKMMARDKFSTISEVILTPEEKKTKLEENDHTFTNEEGGFGDDIDDYKQIEPDRVFSVRGWAPCDKKDSEFHGIADYLRGAKMNKNDHFYKVHRDELERPIYIILRLIRMAMYFPRSMRTSKLTFLDSGRSIFSLDPLTKVVESILASEFNSCLEKDYELNGDPIQMAYEPNRGTTSCNAITFTLCDIALFVSGKPVAQTFADLVKAFNMANRSVMLMKIQKIAGAGDLCFSRFNGRVYTFDGEERGQEFNRGVDPGAPISVLLFKLFMNSDI